MTPFSEQELESIEQFEKEHLDCYHKPDSKQNRISFTIHQTWTGIGVNTQITCDCCGETKNITDYECW